MFLHEGILDKYLIDGQTDGGHADSHTHLAPEEPQSAPIIPDSAPCRKVNKPSKSKAKGGSGVTPPQRRASTGDGRKTPRRSRAKTDVLVTSTADGSTGPRTLTKVDSSSTVFLRAPGTPSNILSATSAAASPCLPTSQQQQQQQQQQQRQPTTVGTEAGVFSGSAHQFPAKGAVTGQAEVGFPVGGSSVVAAGSATTTTAVTAAAAAAAAAAATEATSVSKTHSGVSPTCIAVLQPSSVQGINSANFVFVNSSNSSSVITGHNSSNNNNNNINNNNINNINNSDAVSHFATTATPVHHAPYNVTSVGNTVHITNGLSDCRPTIVQIAAHTNNNNKQQQQPSDQQQQHCVDTVVTAYPAPTSNPTITALPTPTPSISVHPPVPAPSSLSSTPLSSSSSSSSSLSSSAPLTLSSCPPSSTSYKEEQDASIALLVKENNYLKKALSQKIRARQLNSEESVVNMPVTHSLQFLTDDVTAMALDTKYSPMVTIKQEESYLEGFVPQYSYNPTDLNNTVSSLTTCADLPMTSCANVGAVAGQPSLVPVTMATCEDAMAAQADTAGVCNNVMNLTPNSMHHMSTDPAAASLHHRQQQQHQQQQHHHHQQQQHHHLQQQQQQQNHLSQTTGTSADTMIVQSPQGQYLQVLQPLQPLEPLPPPQQQQQQQNANNANHNTTNNNNNATNNYYNYVYQRGLNTQLLETDKQVVVERYLHQQHQYAYNNNYTHFLTAENNNNYNMKSPDSGFHEPCLSPNSTSVTLKETNGSAVIEAVKEKSKKKKPSGGGGGGGGRGGKGGGRD
ncbi:probable serine/threonine-protein kinase cdc7 [Aplysia californica]|uniref:Probable serine/threonine-protein kinase cdc7 n=1 Tax=Aplysia californica TaxID=6500 RepID=A0ABM1A762_APLCA|nr:probable serine/threonine-protein kinase cdc7 [Aplysia californica]